MCEIVDVVDIHLNFETSQLHKQDVAPRGDTRTRRLRVGAARLPRGTTSPFNFWCQLAFLTQNLHQPAGLISPSTSVQAFGSWNSEQLLHC
jgi:hypothetical protein